MGESSYQEELEEEGEKMSIIDYHEVQGRDLVAGGNECEDPGRPLKQSLGDRCAGT